jgi:transcriptional regulator with XRE-family HTH domain/mannose-6-phosphate isomerase-like protein (cupin superfamily)
MAGAEAVDDDARRAALLGEALLAVRTRRGLGVRELARRIDVSASLISRIEKGRVMPSVGTLFALADALEVPVAEILGDPAAPPTSGLPASAGFGGVVPSQGVQRRDERFTLDLASGAHWERLTPGPDPVQFTYSVYRPGGASSPDGEFLRHSGREYGYVVSGRLGVMLGFETLMLEAGDSIAFDSSVPHRLFNDGDVDVVTIWVALSGA